MANRNPVPKGAKTTGEQAKAVGEITAKAVETIINQSSNPKWFPHGITKIDVTIKAYGIDLSVGVSGPDSATPKVAASA